jgi:hypothetical protein
LHETYATITARLIIKALLSIAQSKREQKIEQKKSVHACKDRGMMLSPLNRKPNACFAVLA